LLARTKKHLRADRPALIKKLAGSPNSLATAGGLKTRASNGS
jgi:hypothetical protein